MKWVATRGGKSYVDANHLDERPMFHDGIFLRRAPGHGLLLGIYIALQTCVQFAGSPCLQRLGAPQNRTHLWTESARCK